jgi:hypothetical protein
MDVPAGNHWPINAAAFCGPRFPAARPFLALQNPAAFFRTNGRDRPARVRSQGSVSLKGTPMKPEKVFRIGMVTASIFLTDIKSDSGEKKVRSVNLHRRYRDGDKWKSSTYLSLPELPQAMAVLKLATEYVTSKEADFSTE